MGVQPGPARAAVPSGANSTWDKGLWSSRRTR